MLSGRRLTLFRLFGFKVSIEWSWAILALWLTWSLASNVFPTRAGGQSEQMYWLMGVLGTLGLFGSIVFHELCHSLVARHYGLPIRGITLFIFGGVAEMDEEPPSPGVEFLVALVGPLSSALLGGLAALLRFWGRGGWPVPLNGVLSYLASINLSLAVFNLLPAFPLDGGRVLRSVLWRWQHDIWWGTRIASWIGTLLGNVMIGGGAVLLLTRDLVSSTWLIVAGLYLRSTSRASYRQLAIRLVLEGESLDQFVQQEPIVVPPGISVAEMVAEYTSQYRLEMLPVVDGKQLLGCVRAQKIRRVPRREWSWRTAGDLLQACSADDTIDESSSAMQALNKMSRTGNHWLIVVSGSRLIGIVLLGDLLQFLSLKLDAGHRPGRA